MYYTRTLKAGDTKTFSMATNHSFRMSIFEYLGNLTWAKFNFLTIWHTQLCHNVTYCHVATHPTQMWSMTNTYCLVSTTPIPTISTTNTERVTHSCFQLWSVDVREFISSFYYSDLIHALCILNQFRKAAVGALCKHFAMLSFHYCSSFDGRGTCQYHAQSHQPL